MISSFHTYTGRSLLLLLPLTTALAQLPKLSIATADSILSRFSRHGFLNGKVTIEGTNFPLDGAALTLTDQNTVAPPFPVEHTAFTRSDSSGSFSFTYIPEGQYTLKATYPAYLTYADDVFLRAGILSCREFGLTPDYSRPEMHLTGSLGLEVSDSVTGEAVSTPKIHVLEMGKVFVADVEGFWLMHHLIPQKYHFLVSAWGYGDRTLDSATVIAGHSIVHTVRLLDEAVTHEDLRCRNAHRVPYPVSSIDPATFGTITGTVSVRAANELLADASVFLAPYSDCTTTDSTGTYTFHGLRPGTYCLTVRVPDLERATEHGILVAPGRTVGVNVELRQRKSGGGL